MIVKKIESKFWNGIKLDNKGYEKFMKKKFEIKNIWKYKILILSVKKRYVRKLKLNIIE